MKIRNKLILIISTIILMVLSIGMYFFYAQFSIFIEKRIERVIRSNIRTTTQQILNMIDQYGKINQSMARSEAITRMLVEKKRKDDGVLTKYPSHRVSWIGVFDRHGALKISSNGFRRMRMKEENFFKKAMLQTSVRSVHISEFTGDTVLTIGSPAVLDKDTLGVLIFEYKYKELEQILKNSFIFAEKDEKYLVDGKGIILASSRPSRYPVLKKSIPRGTLQNIINTSHNKSLAYYTNAAGKKVVGSSYYIPQLDNWLVLEMEKKSAFQALAMVPKYLLFSALLALMLLILAVFYSANHITRPIGNLTRAVRELSRGNLDVDIGAVGKDEIGLLAGAFIKMRSKILDTEKRLKMYNKELFEEVAQRTREIKERMAESDEQRRESELLSRKLEELNDELLNEIEERKKAEQALKESEERYRSVSDLTSDYAFAYKVKKDGKLELLWVSGALERITGYTPEEIKEQGGWESLIHPDDISIPIGQLGVLLSGKTSVVEYRIIARDGTKRWMRDYGRPYFDELKNRVSMIYGAVQDITEKKNAEEELTNSEKSYRELFDSSTDAIYIQDRNGVFLAVNSGAEKMYGYPKEYFIGRTPEFVSAEGKNDLEMVASCIEKAFSGEPQMFEFWGKRKNGEIFPKEVRLHKGSYFGKEVIIAMAQDITERKQSEEQLRKLSQALEQSPVSIVILNSRRVIEYVNEGFCAITGFEPEDVIDKDPIILRAENYDEQVYADLWNTIEQGNTWQGELLSRKKEGTSFWEEVTAAPLFDDQGNITHYIAFKIDVTGKKAMEEEFRQALKMEAIGRLAGGVAHDFNNLLTVILGYTELILMKMDRNSPFYKKVKEIDKAGRRAESVTSQLLAFSRKQILQPKVIGINHLIQEMQKMLLRLIGEHIRLELQLSETESLVKTDPGQIEQVLLNLAINSRDAMPSGGTLTILTGRKIFEEDEARQIENIEPGEYVAIVVKDSGQGMEEATVRHIFEPFFTTKEKGRGTGLGLATVYGIIKQSRGHISVHSAPGKGSTFYIYLPLASEEDKHREKEQKGQTDPSGSELILVVEDEESLRELVIETLEKFGYRTLAAADGQEAFDLCNKRAESVDLILTDVVMPSLSGRRLYEKVKEKHPHIKVIYMSGYTDDDVVKQGILTPDTEFIQKPFNLLHLVRKIRSTLDAG